LNQTEATASKCAKETLRHRLSVIERSELVMQGAQHAPATLVRLREERLRSRRQATVECGLLAVLGFYAAIKVVAPNLPVG
jgi:hypothetical protein